VRAAGRASLERLEQWRARAEGRRQLARFDERMLRDIGISRAEVFQEQRKWIWQD
jgi:uncharacterized protein YjiS (DUF1127 family)